ncbi:hypothetical protein [Hwanghaeella sp. 1Z406]|uniref:hypothetical protein n=1 Tax=Hwanghaeella sp. 1Z406 TaxID=3402811 RepID=UPI003B679E76
MDGNDDQTKDEKPEETNPFKNIVALGHYRGTGGQFTGGFMLTKKDGETEMVTTESFVSKTLPAD